MENKDIIDEQIREYSLNYEEYQEFKTMEKKVKQFEYKVKQYMLANGLEELTLGDMVFTIKKYSSEILDRSLVPDIEQYYKTVERITFRKYKNSI